MNRKLKSLMSLLLCAAMLFGMLPAGLLTAFAAGGGSPAEAAPVPEYHVVAWGGIIRQAGKTVTGDSTQAAAGTVLEISLDETKWAGHSFACWKSADGTVIPQKSFRTLVDRLAAFYPVFSDMAGSFGDWETVVRGTYCTDGTLYARTDRTTGLREFRAERGYHRDYTYERVSGEQHVVHCTDCPYTEVCSHYWNAGAVTTEASHLTDGVKTYTCVQCGEKKYELVERSNSHSYPSSPKDSDYVIDEPAVDGKPGRRHLTCTVCGFAQEPKEYILSALPESTKPVRHFTYESKSPYGANSGLNSARVEEHYISDNAYYFSIKAEAVAYQFEFLWVDHGAHSPVYIRSGSRYGTPDTAYYGIIAYADDRAEFLSMINSSYMLSGYNNGRLSSHLTSPYSGSRYFEQLWNDPYQRTKLKIKAENVTRPGWKTPLTEYEYDYGSGRKPLLYVDGNNVCVFQYVGPGDSMELKLTEELDEFPFAEPDRDRITWFGYEVTDGTYPAKSWDSHFGMISVESADDDRRVTPYAAGTGKVFSHWEKYHFDTKRFEFCTDAAIWTPSVSDVTRLRAVFRDVTYHIRVNGGYYQISTGWEAWSEETFTEGDVPYGREIRLWADSSLVPEGKETDGFVDRNGNRLSSYRFRPDADGEYTMTYKDLEAYFEANARNGTVKRDGEAFSGGRFPVGSGLTLTTESQDPALYPYFIGWCRIRYGMSGEELTVVSTDETYSPTVESDSENNRITAVWSASPTLPEKQWHTVSIVRGFAMQQGDGVAVSCLYVPGNTELRVIRDPSEQLLVQTWVASDADTGAVIESRTASEYGTWFFIASASSEDGKGGGKYDGKGGKPGAGGVEYPANVTVTGTVSVCAEDAHVWNEGRVTAPPDYVQDGVKTYTCTVCGSERTEPVAKLDCYCVHACRTCGGCTLPADDPACGSARCTCTVKNPPILFNQTGSISGVSGNVTLVVAETEVSGTADTPYLRFVAEAAEGYEIERIYDLSLRNADGSTYTLPVGETPTVTLTVGRANAEALRDGRMFLTHITSRGAEMYGAGFRTVAVDAEAGTVTFTVESFSPFLLVSTPVARYGRSALAALPNAAALLYAYDRIAEGVADSVAEIGVYNGTDALTKEELETAFDAYRCDYTGHFWLGNAYSVSYRTDTVLSLTPTYLLSGAELESAKAAFETAAAGLLSGITSDMSEYEREKLLHDRLAARVTYDAAAANRHNPYGALVEGRAVCEGYAEAFAYLLRKAGILSFIVTGTSNDPATGTSVGHAWNLVRIDGAYYHTDLTWDDQGETVFYAYFNKTLAAILEDHTIDEKAYALPVCDSETADYFTVNGGKLPAFDLVAVTGLLNEGGGTARVFITGDPAAFIDAFRENLSAIIAGMGLTGKIQTGYTSLGREVILTVRSAEPIRIPLPVPSAGLVYNGTWQQGIPEGTGYRLISGFSALNAGSYTAVAETAPGYAWEDGTTGKREIGWSIAKATPIVSVPTGIRGEQGKTLSAGAILPDGWSWTDGNTVMTETGTHSFPAIYTPEDPVNYSVPAAVEVAVEVTALQGHPAKPTVGITGSYTYNGGEQTATVTGYDSATMNITGNIGTDAGEYTVRVTSKTGQWADGTTEAVERSWTVLRKPVTPTVSVTGEYTWTGTAITPAYTVTVDGAPLDAGEYTVAITDNVDAGTGKITVTDKAGGNYAVAETVATFSIGRKNPPAPVMTDGQNGRWSAGSENGLIFRSDAPFADFIGVLVDGRMIASGQYTVREGSTVVELKPAYLATLTPGEHQLTIRSAGGDAAARFRVEAAAPAEASGFSWTWIVLAAAVLIAAAVLYEAVIRKKRKR